MIHHPILQALIVAYLIHSSFICGKHFFHDQDPEDFIGKHLTYNLLLIVIMLMAPFLYWPPLIWEAMKKLWTLFQCQFFFYLIFTTKYDKLDQEKLYGFNDVAAKYHRKDTFRDKMWRYAVLQLNIRNGYTFIPKQNETTEEETEDIDREDQAGKSDQSEMEEA